MSPDILIRSEGTVWIFCPLTVDAKRFLGQLDTEPWQWLGNALVVDHGVAAGFIQVLLDAGLEVG
jgi:hypothetical protein